MVLRLGHDEVGVAHKVTCSVLFDTFEMTYPIHGCDNKVIAGRALVTVQTCTGADLSTFFVNGEVRRGHAARPIGQRIRHRAKRTTVSIPRFHLWKEESQ